MAFSVPILFLLVVGAIVLSKGPLGQALADRLRGGPTGDARLADELDALRGEVHELRRELAEAQERIDFTERLLSRGRDEQKVH